jgi:5'-3' exonuclease
MAAMTAPQERLMLLDSASIYFRAFYGVPDQRSSSDEPPSNAVRGFLDMTASLIEKYRPTHLVACWDNDWRPAFRVAAIPSYKAHRVADPTTQEEEIPDDLAPQVPYVVDVLTALGIPRVGSDGYEADDVIGTLSHASRGVRPVDIVTGDRDLFQLVDDAAGIRVIYTARGGVRDADLVDEAFLRDRYAVMSGLGYADMSVLRGDTSDGLPGVAGIGEKTAAKLVATYGDLAGLRAAVAAGDPAIKGALRTRLEAATAYLDVAPQVVRVALDAPVPQVDARLPTQVANLDLLARVASELGVRNSVNRVLAALRLGESAPPAQRVAESG